MTDKTLEAVARAIGSTTDFDGDRMASRYADSELRDMAQAAITAARPLIMEEAAGIAEARKYAKHIVEGRLLDGDFGAECFNEGCDEIATAIRAAGEGA